MPDDPEDRVVRLPTGETLTILRTGGDTGGALFEFEAVLLPRTSGPPAHFHRVEQEEFDVVEGTLRVRVGRKRREVGPGESVVVPPGTVHSFANPTGEPVRVRTRETPAGQLEAQMRVLASSPGRLPPLLRLARVNAEHGYSFGVVSPELPQRLVWQGLAGLARFRDRFTPPR